MSDFTEFIQNGKVKRGTLEKIENQIIYANWLGEKLGYTKMEHWHLITCDIMRKNLGGGIIKKYKGSVLIFLRTVYPSFEWLEWHFQSTPKNFWKNIQNQRAYADWLGKILGYTKMEHWHKITANIIKDNYGGGILDIYKGSCIQFLQAIYPEVKWLEWEMGKVSMNFWNKIENRRAYADWLGNKLGYKKMEDWYEINGDIIKANFGGGLLVSYKDSPIKFLRDVYPNFEWLEWNIAKSSMGFWENIENHKKYSEWLGNKLGYITMEDWYKISQYTIGENCGWRLLSYYNGSPIQFLQKIYPDFEWLEWNFLKTSKNYWENIENHKKYTEWLGEKLGYIKPEHWYKITLNEIKKYNGGGLMYYYNDSILKFLKTMFPEYNWDISKFKKFYSKGQIEWLNYLQISIPDIQHMLNHSEGELKIPNSRYYADGYSKQKSIIYEYHGDFWHGNPKIYPSEDIHPVSKIPYGKLYENTLKKQSFCKENGYKYIFIWESEWIRAKLALIILQKKYKKYKKLKK